MTQKMIAQRYVLNDEIGSGGMGTVYKAFDSQSEQIVAIKELRPNLADRQLIERFKREGEALRELNHPNIVKLLDALEYEGQHYLVMEFVGGGDLRHLLEKGKLPYQRTLNIAIDLADALTRAHRLNIIHRDLKPANVLTAEDGTIRLTDFGVAHVIDKERVTQTDAIIGTLDYLPPEAVNGEPIDNRSDIWAFGVMLFEMLAGQRPFSGNSFLATMNAILTSPIPDLEELAADAPVALVDLVYRMLARDSQARISSVRFVGAELEEILQGKDSRPMPGRFETPTPDFRQRPKHNIPAQTSSFVGRESELTELARMLQNPSMRLITIIAQGGMGKTRLSLEAAERAIASFEQGVYFVELAPLSDVESIVPAIALALNYQFQGRGRSAKQEILDLLQAKELLLVFDNFEHLLDGARLVNDLLKAAPKLKILATSRQRLDQAGESLFHLSGMDFPTWETPKDALEYAAVKLFMNSATRAKPDFELTVDNLDDVARICRLVQGMPLGIVLAASWLGMLTPKEVSEELQKGLDFLESDSHQIPERQRSMRAVMDYSWQQMSIDEQAVFANLSVFRGGFTREAAEAVAGANLRILMSLVNKSLLRRDSSTGRYEIHELLRQYAEEKTNLQESRDAHADYFALMLLKQVPLLKAHGQLKAIHQIANDYENCRAAWLWAVQTKSAPTIEKMIDGMYEYLTLEVKTSEGTALFQLAREQWSMSKSEALFLAGRLNARFLEVKDVAQRTRIFETTLEIAESSQNQAEIAFCQRELGLQIGHRSGDELELMLRGQKKLEESLQNFQHLGDRYYEAHVLDDLSFIFRRRRDEVSRIKFSEESLRIYRELGTVVNWSNASVGYIALLIGTEPDKAHSLVDELYEVARRSNIRPMMIPAKQMMFNSKFLTTNDLDLAWSCAEEVFELATEINHEIGLTVSRLNMSMIMSIRGNTARAKELLELAIPNDEKRYSEFTYQVNGLIAEQFYYAANGDYQSLDRLGSQPLKRFLGGINRMHILYFYSGIFPMILAYQGKKLLAVELLGSAYASKWIRDTWVFKQWKALKDFQATLQQELGGASYEVAWERGKTQDFETLIQQVIAQEDR